MQVSYVSDYCYVIYCRVSFIFYLSTAFPPLIDRLLALVSTTAWIENHSVDELTTAAMTAIGMEDINEDKNEATGSKS